MTRPRILLLGGTGEGFAVADTLASRGDLDVVTSMAGATEMPRLPKGRLRRGGFGGVDGLVRYLRDENIVAMIDATHPFAARMSANADAAAAQTGVPLVHVWRQPWAAVAGDRWIEVPSIEAAAAAIPAGVRVFLTTGRSEISAFAARDDADFLARIVQPVERRLDEAWPAQLTFLYDRGPFDEVREAALLAEHRIDVIVSKNSGGSAAYGKLAAARSLGIPVIMVSRPPRPAGRCADSAAGAVAWLDDILADHRAAFDRGPSFQLGLDSKPDSHLGGSTTGAPAFAGSPMVLQPSRHGDGSPPSPSLPHKGGGGFAGQRLDQRFGSATGSRRSPGASGKRPPPPMRGRDGEGGGDLLGRLRLQFDRWRQGWHRSVGDLLFPVVGGRA